MATKQYYGDQQKANEKEKEENLNDEEDGSEEEGNEEDEGTEEREKCEHCKLFFSPEKHGIARCMAGCIEKMRPCQFLRHLQQKHPVRSTCLNPSCGRGIRFVGLDQLIHTVADNDTHCGMRGCGAKFQSYKECSIHLREVHNEPERLGESRNDLGMQRLHNAMRKLDLMESQSIETEKAEA